MEDENVEENFEINNEEPEIKSRANAIEHAERLRTSAQYNGYQELSLAMSSVNDLLYKKKASKAHGEKFWTRTRSKYTYLGEFKTIWLYKSIRL